MSSLPGDAIQNILCRLEVKDLLRYRCVSKPWCSLIDDPHFIKIHLQHSKETDSHLSLIRNDPELNAIDVDTLNSSIRLNPFDERDGVEIVACVDGLLILANFIGDMAIWNPSTKKYKKLLASDLNVNPFPDCIVEYGITGFGYDSVNDDYKLFRMIYYFGMDVLSFHKEIRLYSLKNNSWKKIGDFPYESYKTRENGIFVNGTLNWMVSGESTSYESIIIVGFDLATEEYRKISMPEKKDIYGKETFHTNMTHLGGWLCVVCVYSVNDTASRVGIWVMKEYGVKESWTKLAMVMPSSVTGPFDYLSPLVHFKNANQLLFDQSGDKFMLYDLKRNSAKSVTTISALNKCFDSFLCVRSLVKVCGGERGSNGKKAEENGNKRKKQGQQLGERKRDTFLSTGFKLVL